MRNILITVSYDGTAYCGWQVQTNGNTVAAELIKAIKAVTGSTPKIYGSGRTDSGVHALAQTANFLTESLIPAEKFVCALNAYLPEDIRVRSAVDVKEDFNARFNARGKSYVYRIYNSSVLSPFYQNNAWHVKQPLDVAAMRKAGGVLVGTHDFRAFMASGSCVKDTVRTVYSVGIDCRQVPDAALGGIFRGDRYLSSYGMAHRDGGKIININVTGSGFLYNMVRIIAGTLVYAGNGKLDTDGILRILENDGRAGGAPTAPACGLYLNEVYYSPEDL